jgi:hypothetical protein
MITVNRFQVSGDMKSLFIKVSAIVGRRIDSFTIHTESTYGDIGIDFTDKLLQIGETETITLVPLDLDLDTFSGVYFATFETTEIGVEPLTVAACNVTQFYYNINDLISKVDGECPSCNDNLQNALILDLYLEGLKNALVTSKYTNAIINYFALKRLSFGNIDECTTGCTSGYGVLDGAFILA